MFCLALGIGANTSIFSLIDVLVLRQIPARDPDRVVWILGTTGPASLSLLSYRDYLDYRDHSSAVLSGLAATALTPLNVRASDRSELVMGEVVSDGADGIAAKRSVGFPIHLGYGRAAGGAVRCGARSAEQSAARLAHRSKANLLFPAGPRQ